MEFHKLIQCVQHNDIAWFYQNEHFSECLRISHKKTGDTVLHLICRFGRIDLMKHFLQCKEVDFEVPNYEGKRPLHEAAQFGQLDCVRLLLQHGVQVDCLKRADWTPLMLACTKCELPVITLLLKHGADVTLVNKDGWNSFHIAAREGNVEIFQQLLNRNSNIWNTISHNARTPLHTAALHGHGEAVRFLLDNCDYVPDMADSCGVTPLIDALSAGFVDVAKVLISKHKADVASRDNLGQQALHHAAQAGQTMSVDFLLTDYCVPVNSATPDTCITSLHVAAKEGQDAVIRLLIQKGADVNLVDNVGRTALHIASGAQHASSIRLLLDSGARDVADDAGHFARQLAVHPRVQQVFNEDKS